jgi:nucleoside-diphosphate-sugar epimerase
VQRGYPTQKLDAWCKQHPEVAEVVFGDMTHPPSLAAACANAEGGTILHAAGVIHPKRTKEWNAVNRDGTLSLAAVAINSGVRRFVYVSSNAAQGASNAPSTLLTEEMPCNPLSHYGRSKHEAEKGLLELHQSGSFDVVIARPCMFYGPPVPQRHMEIFKRIVKGQMPMVGDGEFARSLSYIDDLAAGIELCLNHPRAAGKIFNLCDERAYTTREICEAMAAALGVAPKFKRLPPFSAGAAYVVDSMLAAVGIYSMNIHLLGEADWNVGCSSQKATDLLGFKPKVDVQEGYRRAVAWCREEKLL